MRWGGLELVDAISDSDPRYGWPLIAADYWPKGGVAGRHLSIFGLAAGFDFVIAFTILYVTYRFCEWLLRRRGARKGA